MYLTFLLILISIILGTLLILFYNWQGVVILLYHNIGIPEDRLSKDLKRFYVKQQNFKKQIEWLQKNKFNFISLRQMKAFIEGKIKLPIKSIVLTFDDGYKSVYENIFPFLKEKNLPATVFVVVDAAGTYSYWCNKEIQESLLSWEEIAEMQKNNIDFQSHTMTHRELTGLNNEELPYEIIESKLKLEEKLGAPVSFLACPNGAFNERVLEETKTADYLGVVGLRRGLNTKHRNCFLLKRVEIRFRDSLFNFILKVNFSVFYDIARTLRDIFIHNKNMITEA